MQTRKGRGALIKAMGCLEMQVLLLLAIEGSPGVMARGKLNDMMTKRFPIPTIHAFELQTPNMRLFGLQAMVLVYDDRFKGMHLKLTEQSHRGGAVLVVGIMAIAKRNNAFVARICQWNCRRVRSQHDKLLGKSLNRYIP